MVETYWYKKTMLTIPTRMPTKKRPTPRVTAFFQGTWACSTSSGRLEVMGFSRILSIRVGVGVMIGVMTSLGKSIFLWVGRVGEEGVRSRGGAEGKDGRDEGRGVGSGEDLGLKGGSGDEGEGEGEGERVGSGESVGTLAGDESLLVDGVVPG
jgi:hypothetical protein